jgi:hypothetical protein
MRTFHDHNVTTEADRELDARLRQAMMEDTPDVSQVLARVRRGMEPGPAAARRSFFTYALGAVAAALFFVVVTGAVMLGIQRKSVLAVDAACDHFDELMQVSDKKWASAPADVDAYVQRQFPGNRDIVGALAPPGGAFQKLASCRLLSVRFAHFVYRVEGRDVSIFVRISDRYEHPVRRVDYSDRRLGLQVAGFITPRYEGLVVGALSSAATRAIADTVASRL